MSKRRIGSPTILDPAGPAVSPPAMLRLALISLSVLCIACLPHQPSPAGRDFAALVDDYFDALFRWNPTSAERPGAITTTTPSTGG